MSNSSNIKALPFQEQENPGRIELSAPVVSVGESVLSFQAQLLNTIEQSVIATDLDGTVIYWNRFAERLYGWSNKEVLGRNILDLTTPKPNQRQAEEIMSQLRQGKSWTGEFIVGRKDGTTFPAQVINSPVFDANETLIGIVGISHDITERNQSEQALRASENKYRTLVEQASDGIHTYDVQGNFIETNSKLCEMLGYTADELLRLNVKDLVPADDLTANPIRFDELLAGKTLLVERRLLRRDGTIIQAEISGKMIQDGVLQAIIRDISGRRQVEERLRQSEEWLRSIFEASHDGILVEDEEKIIYVNKSYLEMFGYNNAEQLIGQHVSVIISSEDVERVSAFGKRRLSGEQPPAKYEFKGKRKDGTCIDVEASVSTSLVAENTYVTTIIRDISERKRMEILIEAQKKSLEMVVKGAPLEEVLIFLTQVVEQQTEGQTVASILLLDEKGLLRNGASPNLPESYLQAIDGIKADVNVGTCSAAAASRETVITPDIAADLKWQGLAHLPLELGLKAAWTMPIIARDGHVLGTFGTYFRQRREPTDIERQVVEILGRTAALAIEGKQMEEILRGNENQLRLIADAMPLLVSYVDREQHYQFVNQTYTRWFERERKEFVGKHLSEVLGSEAYQKILPEVEKVLAGEEVSYESFIPYKNGERFINLNYVPNIDRASGQVAGFYAFVQDITERKRTQEALQHSREELEFRVEERTKELKKANEARVQVLHQLVTVQEDERQRIARDLHDQFGQQLTALRLKLGVLKKMCDGDEKLSVWVGETQKIARQLDSDIDFLAWQMRPTALDDLGIVAALAHYIQQWSTHFNIPVTFNANRFGKTHLSPETEIQLYRIAQESLNNIYKHAQARTVNFLLEPRDDSAILIIEDDGTGFEPDEQVINRKDTTSIGLIGMYERAVLIGGSLEIESKKGEGTTIYVKVPILAGSEVEGK